MILLERVRPRNGEDQESVLLNGAGATATAGIHNELRSPGGKLDRKVT